ncbi:hypothetical protein HDV05_005458 [Chytridiales sp. JEL 0842]|nr:hypothetical protein HDV05_005458 [Chytridiales sp. JEL 0842]
MTFFQKKGIWKSLLDVNEWDQTQIDPSSPTLHDAAAVARFLGSEEHVRPALHGLISIKVRSATLITFDRTFASSVGAFCSISIRNAVKRTRVVKDNQGTLKWDQTKHFPITIVRNRRHPYNLLKIELLQMETNQPNEHRQVGSVSFHVHDIIKANPIAGTYDLWDDNVQIGDIDLELTFNYGHFGYGYSYQLREEDLTPNELVQYSLLPRVIPRRDQREPDEAVSVVCATPHPKYIPFKEPVYLSYGKEIKDALEEARDEMFLPTSFMKEMDKFEEIRDEYFSTNDRVERLMFLRNYLKNAANQQETMGSKPDEPMEDTIPSKNYTRFVLPLASGKSDPNQAGAAGKTFMNRMTATHTLQVMSGGIIKSRELIYDDKAESPTSPKSNRLPGSWPGAKTE